MLLPSLSVGPDPATMRTTNGGPDREPARGRSSVPDRSPVAVWSLISWATAVSAGAIAARTECAQPLERTRLEAQMSTVIRRIERLGLVRAIRALLDQKQ